MLERLEYCKKYELDISGEDLCLGEAKLGAPITHGQVVALSNILKKDPVDTGASFPLNHTLAELLRGSEVYIEPMKPKTEPVS